MNLYYTTVLEFFTTGTSIEWDLAASFKMTVPRVLVPCSDKRTKFPSQNLPAFCTTADQL